MHFFVWRYKLISAKDLQIQINEDIRLKELRLVGVDGEQLGIMSSDEAQELAYTKGLDLVLISPQATPPVCRIMDYGKYRFERMKKEKENKKKQQISKVKEIQLSCRIDTHDFETRVNHAKRFLSDGDKVRAVVRFKGREMTHTDIGRSVLENFMAACAEFADAEKSPVMEGRFMSITLAPKKQK